MSWVIPLFALIPILLGVGFIVAGTVTKGASKNWQPAQGVVAPSKWGLERRKGQRYRWQGPDGVVRDGQGYSRTLPKPDGAPVTVLYDPQDLNRFRLASDTSVGTVFIVIGWVVAVVGLLALALLMVLLAVLA